jgi:hypothetical protein
MKKIMSFWLAILWMLPVGSQPWAQVRISQSSVPKAEPHVAVNPTNPNNIVVVAITQLGFARIGAYYTTNGGNNWSGSDDIVQQQSVDAGDPVVAFDGAGNVYVLYQVRIQGELYLRKSTDGGATWEPEITVFTGDPDRPWMAIDESPNAAGFYDIFVTVTDFQGSQTSSIVLSTSTNGGASFSGAILSPAGNNQGSYVAIGPDNDVFVAWAELNSENAVTQIKVRRSTDRGATFGTATSFSAAQIGIRSGDTYYLIVNGVNIRADSYPHLAIDRSPNPSTRGKVYLTWANKGTSNSADVVLRVGTRSGGSISWSNSINLAAGGNDEWMPAVNVNPDGRWNLLYYYVGPANDEISVQLREYPAGSTTASAWWDVGMEPRFRVSAFVFLGDYVGVAGWYGKAYATWIEARGLVGGHTETQAYFRSVNVNQEPVPANHVGVTVRQTDESDTDFGKFGRWRANRFVEYAAPHYFVWQTSTSEVLRANQQFKPNTTQKYNNWFNVNDVLNHRAFGINVSTTFIQSRFRPAHTLTIRTELIDGGSGDGQMEVHFRDPWLIDFNDPPYGMRNQGQQLAEWYPQTSPFVPGTGTNYMGVFLNQNPDLSPAFYKVRAPLTQPNINNFGWHFIDWKTTGTTQVTQPTSAESPVIFGATNDHVIARYKAHLASSLAGATFSNSQRKYAADVGTLETKVALCYSSAGEIWLSESTDMWSPLSDEVRVSDGVGGFDLPSVVVTGRYDEVSPDEQGEEEEESFPEAQVAMVYQRDAGNSMTVYFREKLGDQWYNPVVLVSYPLWYVDATPVIGRTGGAAAQHTLVAVWVRENYGLWYRARGWSGGWGSAAPIPGTDGGQNPSISTGYKDYPIGEAPLYLTYDDGSTVYMQTFGYAGWLSSPHTVPASSGYILSFGSQVSADTRDADEHHVHIVWEARDLFIELPSTVMYQGYNSKSEEFTEGAQFSSGQGYNFHQPTITSLASGKLMVSWHDAEQSYYAFNEGEEWWMDDRTYPHLYPNLASFGPSGPTSETQAVATGQSGAPYPIVLSQDLSKSTGGGAPRTSTITSTYHRKAVVAESRKQDIDSTGVLELEISSVRLKMQDGSSTTLEFVPMATDTGTGESKFWSRLGTRPVRIGPAVDSVMVEGRLQARSLARLRAPGWNAHRLLFEVVDARTDEVLGRVGTERNLTANGRHAITERGRIAQWANREVYLRPVIRGMVQGSKDILRSIVHVYTVWEDSLQGLRPSAGEPLAKVDGLPDRYALHPNFPNPFNPTTTFTFDIPYSSFVILKVYDVLGREVAVLVQGTREAGYHSAAWNAGEVSSGVYFARFTATDAEGAVRLNKVSKLLLTK